jgi:hypothetical protein
LLLTALTASNSNIEILERFQSLRFAHDNGRTLVRAEYGYPKGSPGQPTAKEEIRHYSSQYGALLSAHHTSMNLMEQPHNKTPAK